MNRSSKWNEEVSYKLTQEITLLKDLKEVQKIKTWKGISFELNKNFPDKYRTPKQCREKYINSASFGPDERRISDWTREEDETLFDFYFKEGPKWGLLVERIPGR